MIVLIEVMPDAGMTLKMSSGLETFVILLAVSRLKFAEKCSADT